MDGADVQVRGYGTGPSRARRRGLGYAVSTPILLVFMFFVGVGATVATLYWTQVVDREQANRAEAERLAAEQEALNVRQAAWEEQVRRALRNAVDRARALRQDEIRRDTEDIMITLRMVGDLVRSADLRDEEQLREFDLSRDTVTLKLLAYLYPELTLEETFATLRNLHEAGDVDP